MDATEEPEPIVPENLEHPEEDTIKTKTKRQIERGINAMADAKDAVVKKCGGTAKEENTSWIAGKYEG